MGLGTCTFSLLIGRRASHKDRKAHLLVDLSGATNDTIGKIKGGGNDFDQCFCFCKIPRQRVHAVAGFLSEYLGILCG